VTNRTKRKRAPERSLGKKRMLRGDRVRKKEVARCGGSCILAAREGGRRGKGTRLGGGEKGILLLPTGGEKWPPYLWGKLFLVRGNCRKKKRQSQEERWSPRHGQENDTKRDEPHRIKEGKGDVSVFVRGKRGRLPTESLEGMEKKKSRKSSVGTHLL